MTDLSQALELRKSDAADRDLTARLDYARKLSASELLPEQYRGKPQNVLVAAEYGSSVGIDPITAMQQVHVIKGKPTASAQLMGALVRKAGHKLRITTSADTATAVLIRSDDPDFEFTVTWTMERARTAGLTSNANYKNYGPNMLAARAISEVVRYGAPEVLAGFGYTPDELGADVAPVLPATDEAGEVVEDVPTADVVDAELVDGSEGIVDVVTDALFDGDQP